MSRSYLQRIVVQPVYRKDRKLITFVGDIHGNVHNFLHFAENEPETVIQVGDFGFGFLDIPETFKSNVSFIRGNHDDPSKALAHPNVIKDGSTWNIGEYKAMAVGGALSIDKEPSFGFAGRTEGVDWWAGEELSTDQLFEVVDIYDQFKPDIMITHDCPRIAMRSLFGDSIKAEFPSRTQQALSVMFSLHKPKVWLFGHYHQSRHQEIDGCLFQCVGENAAVRLNETDLTFVG